MKYTSGEDLRVGDTVSLGGGVEGSVVALVGDGVFSNDFPGSEWGYLRVGFLVLSPQIGLVHFPKMIPDVRLIARAGVDP